MRKGWDNSATAAGGSANAPQTVPTKTYETPVPASLKIGNVTISPATVLAPMAGVTDTVFRRFIRNLGGCGLIMTEFTSADGVLRGKDQKAKRYLHFYEDEHPISAQLFGSDPRVMADAARMVEGLEGGVVLCYGTAVMGPEPRMLSKPMHTRQSTMTMPSRVMERQQSSLA